MKIEMKLVTIIALVQLCEVYGQIGSEIVGSDSRRTELPIPTPIAPEEPLTIPRTAGSLSSVNRFIPLPSLIAQTARPMRTFSQIPMIVGFPVLMTRLVPRQSPVTLTANPIRASTQVTQVTPAKPRTAPKVVGFPVFETRLVAVTPRQPDDSTTASTTTDKSTNGIPFRAVTTISPTTLTLHTTEIVNKVSSTTRTFTTTTPTPRTVPMVVGFPIFDNRDVTRSTPPEKPITTTVSTTTKKENVLNHRTTLSHVTNYVPGSATNPMKPDTVNIRVNANSTPSVVTSVTQKSLPQDPRSLPIPNAVTISASGNQTEGVPNDGLPIFENRTVNISNETSHISIVGLCGYPPYNDRLACHTQDYFSDPLSTCEVDWGRILFGILTGAAATAIIGVNILIPAVVIKNKDMRTHYDYMKVSLAIADVIIGFLLFTSVIPNMIWIRNFTEREIVELTKEDANSPTAIAIGSLFGVAKQTSLLHLCFLSIERFLSIKFSFWRLRRKTKSIVLTLAAIWIGSIVAAFLPAVFPGTFEYQFQPALLVHLLTLKPQEGTNTEVGIEGVVYVLFTMVLPYIAMVTFCVLTGVVSYNKLISRARFFGDKHTATTPKDSSVTNSRTADYPYSPSPEKKKTNLRPEIRVFITILIMIGAYTITLVPFTVVVALFVIGYLDCGNYTTPYVAAFYFGLLNSLANGVIYSVREIRFRTAVKQLFSSSDPENSSKGSSNRHTHSSKV